MHREASLNSTPHSRHERRLDGEVESDQFYQTCSSEMFVNADERPDGSAIYSGVRLQRHVGGGGSSMGIPNANATGRERGDRGNEHSERGVYMNVPTRMSDTQWQKKILSMNRIENPLRWRAGSKDNNPRRATSKERGATPRGASKESNNGEPSRGLLPGQREYYLSGGEK